MALNSGKVSKYITDFPNDLMVKQSNVIAIPHLGASTNEAEDNCAVMVSTQLREFLLDGTIQHSVNFPSTFLERSTPYRLTIVNQNVPNVIGQVTSVIANAGVNISEMVNKSREDIAYTIIDLDQDLDQQVVDQLLNIEGVVRVRQLPPYDLN